MRKPPKKKVSGKTTVRELWVCDKIAADYIRDDLDFPGVQQVGHIRKTICQDGKVLKKEDWYGITSCTREELAPEVFLDMVRKHWEIENGLHHVKDRSWFEDHQYSKDQTKGGILGVFRNMSLNAMRVLCPPSQSRKKRKYDKSLPRQALSYLIKPLKTLARLIKI